MFKSAYQKKFLTIFFSCGAKPLGLWAKHVQAGHIKRITDEDVKSLVLELIGLNIVNTYITCPCSDTETLAVRLPFIVIVVKNLNKLFSFEIQIRDDRNMKRRFRVSNFQSSTKVLPFACTMPIGLNPGWNQIQFNLQDFTRRAYALKMTERSKPVSYHSYEHAGIDGTTYVETTRVQINANCRLRRIYFCDQLYPEDKLPKDYKLYQPKTAVKKKEVLGAGGALPHELSQPQEAAVAQGIK